MPRASKSKKAIRTSAPAMAKKLAGSVKKKPAVAAEKTTSAKKAPTLIKKTRKARVGNVRELILKSLRGGSKTRPALQKATGASYNGLVMHLSKLKDEGLVQSDTSNRMMSLVSSAASDNAATIVPAKTKRPKSTVSASLDLAPIVATVLPMPVSHAREVLSDAIELLKSRLARAEDLDEKVLVLDALAGQIGGPVAEVLMGIKSDLLR